MMRRLFVAFCTVFWISMHSCTGVPVPHSIVKTPPAKKVKVVSVGDPGLHRAAGIYLDKINLQMNQLFSSSTLELVEILYAESEEDAAFVDEEVQEGYIIEDIEAFEMGTTYSFVLLTKQSSTNTIWADFETPLLEMRNATVWQANKDTKINQIMHSHVPVHAALHPETVVKERDAVYNRYKKMLNLTRPDDLHILKASRQQLEVGFTDLLHEYESLTPNSPTISITYFVFEHNGGAHVAAVFMNGGEIRVVTILEAKPRSCNSLKIPGGVSHTQLYETNHQIPVQKANPQIPVQKANPQSPVQKANPQIPVQLSGSDAKALASRQSPQRKQHASVLLILVVLIGFCGSVYLGKKYLSGSLSCSRRLYDGFEMFHQPHSSVSEGNTVGNTVTATRTYQATSASSFQNDVAV